jgi:hypothetical protein
VNLADFHKLVNTTRNDPRFQEAIAKAEGTEAPRLQPQPAPAPAPATTTAIAPAPQPAPAPAPAPVPGAPPIPAPAPPADDDTHIPIQPDASGRLPQIKFRPQGGVDQTALILAKTQGKPVTDIGIINAARAAHGLPALVDASAAPAPQGTATSVAGAPAAAPAPAPAPTPASVSAIDTQIAELRAQRKEARTNFDFDREEEIETQMETLAQQRTAAAAAESAAQTQAVQTRDQQFAEAGNRVAQVFPALANPQSELAVLSRAKHAAAVANGDAFAWDPRCVEYFANEAARDLGLAPSVAAPATAPSPAPVVPPVPTPQPFARPPGSQILSSGGPQVPVSHRAPTDGHLTGNSTPDDVNKLLASLTGVQYGGHHRPAER